MSGFTWPGHSDGKKIKKLHDGQGLYLWVYADGKKYWRLRYNVWSRKITILRHPPRHKPEAGKAKRTGWTWKAGSNIDPSIDRKVTKQRAKQAAENSFEAVSREWYAKQIHTWVHSHAKDVKRRLELSGQFSTGVNKCSCPNDSTHLSCTKC